MKTTPPTCPLRFRQLPPFASLLALILLSATAFAQPLFEVVPPEKVPFNYPAPPREGAPDFFPIAKDGVARCVIVQPANASPAARAAVTALQSYLNLVTGARVMVLGDDVEVPGDMAAIHVGDTTVARKTDLQLPDLRYGDDRWPNARGYLVKTLDRRTLIIRGADEKATEHGIIGILKRYVGIRQYWPGKPGGLGDVIPSRPTLVIPELEWRDWPYFFSTQLTQQAFGSRPALDFYRRNQTLHCGENYDDWLKPSKYAQTHPEYFPLIDGKRRIPSSDTGHSGWQPCVSNPEVVQIMGAAVIDFFRQHPESPGINAAINDGGGDCTCAACRAMDAPGTDYSRRTGMGDRYVKFTNQICEIVGREFPSKWIVYLAYAAAQHAPKTLKPHPTLLPVLTTPENMFEQWDQWMKSGPRHMGVYLHHNDTFFVLPKLDIHQNARRIRYIVASGKARVIYVETHINWPSGDTLPYVLGELLWDPRQNVDALLDEYFTSFYGRAAGAMRAFHNTVEAGYERWLAEEGEAHPFAKDISSSHDSRALEQFRVLTPEEAERASAALAQAANTEAADPKIAERIEVVRQQFHLQNLAVQWAWAAFRLRDAAPKSEADARRMIDDARLIFDRSRQMRRHIEKLEQPPLSAYSLFHHSTRAVALFDQMKSGEPGPEMAGAITAGLNAAGDFLRGAIGQEKAAAWWHALAVEEKEPALAASFQAAERRASGQEPKNQLADPGFEQIGRQLAGNEFVLERDVVLDPAQMERIGLHVWFADRTPSRCALTETGAHSGRHALMLEHFARVRFSQSLAVKPGERYRVGLWFRQNEGAAKYRFAVDARLANGSYPALASTPIPSQPGKWREFATEVVAPPEATTIFVRLFVDQQAADARCWLDDAFIGK